MAKEVKLLLLGMRQHRAMTSSREGGVWRETDDRAGAGESGKSTVLKQMRLIHAKGFTVSERQGWKVTIFQNLLHAFQVVFGAMEEQEVDFAKEDNVVSAIEVTIVMLKLTSLSALCRSGSWRPRSRSRRPYARRVLERVQSTLGRRWRANGDQEG
jgi:hypothetical protein